MKSSIYNRFYKKYNETGYTVQRIEMALFRLGLEHYKDKIQDYVSSNNLLTDNDAEGIRLDKSSEPRYLMKESDIEKVINGLKMPVSFEQFKWALAGLFKSDIGWSVLKNLGFGTRGLDELFSNEDEVFPEPERRDIPVDTFIKRGLKN